MTINFTAQGYSMINQKINLIILLILFSCKVLGTSSSSSIFPIKSEAPTQLFQTDVLVEFSLKLNPGITFEYLFKEAKDKEKNRTNDANVEEKGNAERNGLNLANSPNAELITQSSTTSGQIISIPVFVSIKGNTSILDCDFLKLEVKLTDKTKATQTIFSGTNKFKINTHCGEENRNKRPKDDENYYGRLFGDRNPIREFTAYQLINETGTPTLGHTLAKITYFDETEQYKGGKTHYALILEANKTFVNRLKSNLSKNEQIKSLEKTDYKQLALPINFINIISVLNHSLINNTDHMEDFAVSEKYPKTLMSKGDNELWNYLAYKAGVNTYAIPVDFDLSMLVRQDLSLSPPLPTPHVWANAPYNLNNYSDLYLLSEIHKIRMMLSRADFNKVVSYYQNISPKLLKVISSSNYLGENEKNYMGSLIKKFISFIETANNIPVLAQDNFNLYYTDDPTLKAKKVSCSFSASDPDTQAKLLPLAVGSPIILIDKKETFNLNDFIEISVIDIFNSQFNPLDFGNCVDNGKIHSRRYFIKLSEDAIKDVKDKTIKATELIKTDFELINNSILDLSNEELLKGTDVSATAL